ncbi:MAG: ATP-binding cassette domain-containing protein [Ignavibacteriales bacterium]|nr:ATP-binding cassette domain-containing protein [Ignavibacteriales bacterium]
MLKAENIAKRYGTKKAVNGVSFSLSAGKITGLLGHNGAGKTTTIRLLLGLIAPDSGSVVYSAGTHPVWGYVPEEKGLYKNASAIENIIYLASMKGIPKKTAVQRTAELLNTLKLQDFTGQKVSALSKGFQQITQIIAALIHNPDVLLFDEPYGGLDPSMQEAFTTLLKEQCANGKAVLISTHLLEKAEVVCDSILLMKHGSLVYNGSITGIFQDSPAFNLQYFSAGSSNEIPVSAVFADVTALNRFFAANPTIQVHKITHSTGQFKDRLKLLLEGNAEEQENA